MRNAGVVKTFLVMTFRSGIDTARERRRRDRYVAGGVGASPSRGRGHNSRCLCGRVSGNPKDEQPRALPSTPPRRARACAVASKLSTTTTPLERVVRPVLRSVWLDAIAMRHGWVFRQSGKWAYLHEQGVRVLARLGKKNPELAKDNTYEPMSPQEYRTESSALLIIRRSTPADGADRATPLCTRERR
jgi:hypothetical protein